jgi:hypothetical protein
MAITIVVETGLGTTPTANSYASVADLVAYAAQKGAVLPVAADDQAAMLLNAMEYVEAQRGRFKGVKTSQVNNNSPDYGYFAPVSNGIAAEGAGDQPLQWPRTDVWIDNGLLGPNTIPRELVYGQLAQALRLNDQNLNPSKYEVRGPVTEQTVSGAVTVRYASPSANPGHVLPVNAFADPDTLLRVLYRNGGLSVVASRA